MADHDASHSSVSHHTQDAQHSFLALTGYICLRQAALLKDLHIVVPVAIPSVFAIYIVVSIAYTIVQASVPVPITIARTL